MSNPDPGFDPENVIEHDDPGYNPEEEDDESDMWDPNNENGNNGEPETENEFDCRMADKKDALSTLANDELEELDPQELEDAIQTKKSDWYDYNSSVSPL